ncbi:hypothetical protein SAMN05192545_2883 [Maribacter dokdonensis]|uniref:Uncharacterized protein n=1 Tax=Maribacter dokdonensis TaxID=320912 RepID=A0ABY0UTF4_9FLAO|nr:hypothetical protein SAMN05192545_2883 [Maribacter dokdonensis]
MYHYIETKHCRKGLIRRVDVSKASTSQIVKLKKFLWKMYPSAMTYNLLSDEELEHHYKETA